MNKPHDVGGSDNLEPIDQRDHAISDWELHIDAIRQVLGNNGIINTDELRRTIESIRPDDYRNLLYYERWSIAIRTLLLEKAILSQPEIDLTIAQIEGMLDA